MSYKFITDNNIWDEKEIPKLRNAGIVKACSGRLAFYFTPVLLKEGFDFLRKGPIPDRAVEAIKLLTELRWQKCFNDLNGPEGIFTFELEGKPSSEYLFLPSEETRNIIENSRLILKGGELTPDGKKQYQDYHENWAKRKIKNKEAYALMRDDVTKVAKAKNMTRKGSKFSDFLKDNLEETAIEKIQKSINSNHPRKELIKYWKENKEKCYYFNKFIEGCLFTAWYYMAVEKQPAIDINAYEDIEHLIYLIGCDGIVSNEKGFMKAAAAELFPEKDFLSIDEFVLRLTAASEFQDYSSEKLILTHEKL